MDQAKFDADLSAALERAVDTASRELAQAPRRDRVPPAYAWATFRSPLLAQRVRDPETVALVRGLAQDLDSDPFIVLTGETGAGKSVLLCAYLRERERCMRAAGKIDDDTLPVRWATVLDIVLHQDAAETCMAAEHADVLGLDDVDRHFAFMVTAIVRERIRQGRPTIVVTPHLTEQAMIAKTGNGDLARLLFGEMRVIEVRNSEFIEDLRAGRLA